jgi:hypothetical protein
MPFLNPRVEGGAKEIYEAEERRRLVDNDAQGLDGPISMTLIENDPLIIACFINSRTAIPPSLTLPFLPFVLSEYRSSLTWRLCSIHVTAFDLPAKCLF